MANFPNSAPSFTTKNAGDTIQASHVDDLQGETTALGTVLLSSMVFDSTRMTALKFPAAQTPSSDANTLDDYEEGTFNPTFISTGGGAPTYAEATGYYIKVARLVTCTGLIRLGDKGTLAAGNVTIGALPFTIGAGSNVANATISYFANNTTAVTWMGGLGVQGTTTFVLYLLTAAATGVTQATVANLGATQELAFTISYLASQ
jgi:hypothetical protein